MTIKEKINRNSRNKNGILKGKRFYYHRKRGIVLIDEDLIKRRLTKMFTHIFK